MPSSSGIARITRIARSASTHGVRLKSPGVGGLAANSGRAWEKDMVTTPDSEMGIEMGGENSRQSARYPADYPAGGAVPPAKSYSFERGLDWRIRGLDSSFRVAAADS